MPACAAGDQQTARFCSRYDAEGAYSKDGKLIAYCSDSDGDADIYVMNADGSNKRQLTDAPGYDGGPFISPDGKWIVFRSDRKMAEHLQIYVIGVDPDGVQGAISWRDRVTRTVAVVSSVCRTTSEPMSVRGS